MVDSVILDSRGRPIQKAELKQASQESMVGGVRRPETGYPGDGLNPKRLASILKEADIGNPVRFLELAEAIEERDPHLIGVLGTRKRSVSQLEITVKDGSADATGKKHGDMVREWIDRDELSGELFHMLDAIHKGYSFTEIMWAPGKDWWPERLEWRDPRWFDFERQTLTRPQEIQPGGERLPLPGGKYIYAPMPAKSGIPTRGGLARVLAWAWMFKAFTNRDWAIFTQTYGQPIRIGKYGQGASNEDKATLFAAVANIAGDCAAIIPESMKIEFQSAEGVASSAALYKERADFFDQQTSKAVLGQTATTDAIAGGHAVGQEHRQVQEDIERSDAKLLSAIINQDLVRIWIDLQFGPQLHYPKIRIGRPEEKNVELIVSSVKSLRLPVKKSEIYGLLGLTEPQAGDDLLEAPAETPPGAAGQLDDPKGVKGLPPPAVKGKQALHAEQPALPKADDLPGLASSLVAEAQDAVLDAIGDIVRQAKTMDEVREALLTLAPGIDTAALKASLRQALVIATLMGRHDLING